MIDCSFACNFPRYFSCIADTSANGCLLFPLQILELPSELFYNKQLVACFQQSSPGPRHIPPMVFHNVRGQESQDADSPSFYNEHEAAAVVGAVEDLVNGSSPLSVEDICVVSPYTKQVQFIRSMLRPKRLGRVSFIWSNATQCQVFT